MKILIVSDTHRQTQSYFDALNAEKPVDMVIHCGDLEGDEEIFRLRTECPVVMVSGNNDFFGFCPKDQMFTLGRYKIFVTHGHFYGVSLDTQRIREEARERGANIVMFGHTHRPLIDLSGDVIALNPGSLAYPRQEGNRPSYMVMEIDDKGEATFEIRYL